jgi:hypothetical protein
MRLRDQSDDAVADLILLSMPADQRRNREVTDARVIVSSPGRNYVTLVIETGTACSEWVTLP